MSTRELLIETLAQNRKAVIPLRNAKIVKFSEEVVSYSWHTSKRYKVVVHDSIFGHIYFHTSSKELKDATKNSYISGNILVTGIGAKTEKYTECILFAKKIRGNSGTLIITSDSSVDSSMKQVAEYIKEFSSNN